MTALLTDDATREAARLHVSDYCDVDQGAMEPETKAWAEGIYRAGARFAQGIYEARLGEDAKVRAQLVEALEAMIYDHGCGTTYVKCKSPDCAANIGRAAIAASKEGA